MILPRLVVLLAASTMLASGASAQTAENPLHAALGAPEDLTITASIRPRIEAIDSQFRPAATRSDTLLSIRTTLAVDWHPGPFFIGARSGTFADIWKATDLL